MTTNDLSKNAPYKKHHSFDEFFARNANAVPEQTKRALECVQNFTAFDSLPSNAREVLTSAAKDLANSSQSHSDTPRFKITQFIAEELAKVDAKDVPRYVYHRYRYDIFPLTKTLDEYPPYLQIEPSSICNFRCVFCYQTDRSFNTRASGHMGTMTADMFKRIVDQAEGNVEFISLASRGEPLVCKQLPEMLEYSRGKFLGLKLNTNASLMTEATANAILSGGVNTLVFSADAAEEPLYSQLRVNGSLEKTLRNIELFQSVRQKSYSDSKLITRVSGVKVRDEQDMDTMTKVWSGLVDQIAFVKYNPWENIYETEPNGIETPCSDLWRRMFVWYDGAVNPCDTDYKTTLKTGTVLENSISEIWRSERYEHLRRAHQHKMRQNLEPCKRCSVT